MHTLGRVTAWIAQTRRERNGIPRRGGGEVPEPATSGNEPKSRNQCGASPAKPRGIYFACVSSAGWGVSPLQGPHPWEPPPEEQLTKIEELRRMLGSGPLLEGVDASGIQKGLLASSSSCKGSRLVAVRLSMDVRLPAWTNNGLAG